MVEMNFDPGERCQGDGGSEMMIDEEGKRKRYKRGEKRKKRLGEREERRKESSLELPRRGRRHYVIVYILFSLFAGMLKEGKLRLSSYTYEYHTSQFRLRYRVCTSVPRTYHHDDTFLRRRQRSPQHLTAEAHHLNRYHERKKIVEVCSLRERPMFRSPNYTNQPTIIEFACRV